MFALWLIWKGRNQLVFENKRLNPRIDIVITNRAVEYTHCAGRPLMPKQRIIKQIRWEKPSRGWMKLNVDGASKGNPGQAGGGRLLRDENRN